jgi:hypothetical protein
MAVRHRHMKQAIVSISFCYLRMFEGKVLVRTLSSLEMILQEDGENVRMRTYDLHTSPNIIRIIKLGGD